MAYEGTGFCGWQIQRGVGRHENPKPSIEGALVSAIRALCEGEERVTVTASGRTDAGVHASGQVVHFDLTHAAGRYSDENLRRGLIERLPDAIQVLRLSTVPPGFHAKQALRKQYSFFFQLGPAALPHLRNFTVWNRLALDHARMHTALQALVGKHNFAAFCGGGSQASSTIREIFEAEVSREAIPIPGCALDGSHHLIRIRLCGSGFLKQMVRRIAGTLRKIGEGQLPIEALETLLERGERDAEGVPAPPRGLWLDRVCYPAQEGIDFLDQLPRV